MQPFGRWPTKVFVVLKFAVAFAVVINSFREASKQIYNSYEGELAASFNQPARELGVLWGSRSWACFWWAGPAPGRSRHGGAGQDILGMLLGSPGVMGTSCCASWAEGQLINLCPSKVAQALLGSSPGQQQELESNGLVPFRASSCLVVFLKVSWVFFFFISGLQGLQTNWIRNNILNDSFLVLFFFSRLCGIESLGKEVDFALGELWEISWPRLISIFSPPTCICVTFSLEHGKRSSKSKCKPKDLFLSSGRLQKHWDSS